MSNRNVAQNTTDPKPLAPLRVAGNFDAEFEEIYAYLRSPHGKTHVRTDIEREALLRLAFFPYHATSIEEHCKLIAVVLETMQRAQLPGEMVHELFEAAVIEEMCQDTTNTKPKRRTRRRAA